jgi:predicted CXXCH cytochrome family protein
MNSLNDRTHHGRGLGVALITLSTMAALLGGCSSSSDSKATPSAVQGTVTGTSGVPVAGATVYLVPTTSVSTEEITGAGVLAGSTLTFDEPLEDAVANDGPSFPQDVTAANGTYKIEVPDGKFFLYVEPGVGDTEHIRGGSLCKVAGTEVALRGATYDIVLSSSPSPAATFIGMSSCLTCHPDYTSETELAHRLGFRVPGVSSPLQDTSYHPEIDDGLAFFLDAVDYTGGTPVYHYDPDSSRGFDDFQTSLTDPSPGGTVHAILWLWRDTGSSEYKITIENAGNPADPNNFAERVVKLTYGGAVEKQRYMIEWPGLNGLYPLLQYQTIGDDSRYDRTRKVFRDYHLDFYWDGMGTDGDETDDLIMDPSITRNIARNCMGCHATNYTQYTDGVTGEVLCDTLEDPNGEYDIDGDGFINDLNTGCESCHGPGSEHAAAFEARYIITPENMSPSRSNQLCGRCHNRQEGADPIGGDHPLNAASEFPPPGISRAEFLAEYVKPTVMGPKASKYWADFTHSKSHHQQYPDFVKSAHYRNGTQLVTCSDCHDVHGGTGFKRALIHDPDAPDSALCMQCHASDIVSTAVHTAEVLGVAHGSAIASCSDCHLNKTAKTGSGDYGFLLAAPTGTSADTTTVYHENDITSHVFDVPDKFNVGVTGVLPSSAMPIPYTQRCGTCHDPSNLQY